MNTVPKLPREEFIEVVRRTPLISFDLLVREQTGRILLGLRKNEPARNYWFVPGGIIRKGERLADAFSRITNDELGRRIDLNKAVLKGIFEHHYEENVDKIPGFGTHYVVMAYEMEWPDETAVFPAAQHDDYQWFTEDQIRNHAKVHPYTRAYFAV